MLPIGGDYAHFYSASTVTLSARARSVQRGRGRCGCDRRDPARNERLTSAVCTHKRRYRAKCVPLPSSGARIKPMKGASDEPAMGFAMALNGSFKSCRHCSKWRPERGRRFEGAHSGAGRSIRRRNTMAIKQNRQARQQQQKNIYSIVHTHTHTHT